MRLVYLNQAGFGVQNGIPLFRNTSLSLISGIWTVCVLWQAQGLYGLYGLKPSLKS